MGDSLEFEIAKIACEEEWETLFPKHEPKTGEDLHDYISEKAFPVGA